MTKTQQIQNLIKRDPKLSVAQVAKKLGVSKVTVYAVRSKMRSKVEDPKPAPTLVIESAPIIIQAPTNAKQVGGDHYTSLDIQPWEIIERNQMGFFDGNALKYLLRFRAKGGVQDLEKARHYLDKLIELERGRNT